MEARAAAPAFRPAPRDVSRPTSVEPPLVFDDIPEEDPNDQYTEPTTGFGSGLEEQGSYDLKPPPPNVAHNNIETLALRFFSVEHLNTILEDPALSARFSKFLHQYRAAQVPKLTQYFEAKKAQTAVAYANAVAEQISSRDGKAPYAAATLDERFEAQMRETVEALVEDALPAYVTHRLTLIATESLVKEITGNNAPIMRELIPSLAEVYCITDPSMPDNPIVYASQEFYNTSQYGKDYVLGRNCRFLQGPKTSNASVRRMIEALTTGQEITETILNYRRDGSPFMNLLLIAPLYDNKGNVRYFLGCQIDVSSLIDEGRGLESFATLLSKQRSQSRYGDSLKKDPKHMLSEFGAALNEEEGNIIKNRTRSFSEEGVRPSSAMSGGGGSVRTPRRRLGMDDAASDRHLWPDTALGPSGRLPGVYQNYFLVRPYPSLRITFTSPALRIPGLLQTKFLDRIGGPESVREGLLESFAHGTGVTAKITWLSSNNGGLEGKPRWIHCTPLLGSDEKVGVWMVVMVDNEEITGGLRRSMDVTATASVGAASPRFTGNKLYAEYLRREGRPGTAGTDGTSESAKEKRDVDDRFRDF